MSSKKIDQLPAASSIANSDGFPASIGAITKRVSLTLLKSTLKSYFDGLYDTLNAASTAVSDHNGTTTGVHGVGTGTVAKVTDIASDTNLSSAAQDAVSKRHARQHAITGTSDHTSSATSGKMLKADSNGLPVDASNTDTEVAAAVTASHAAVTAGTAISLDGQKVSVNLGTGATDAAAGNDSRLSDARTPTAHNQSAETITSGTLDGDRLPAPSETKRGGVKPVGTATGKFLRDDDTWTALGGAASLNVGTSTGTVAAGDDSRLSDARTPTAHNQSASTITSDTLDGDRLPAMSTTKKGAVPATGTPSGKVLSDGGGWVDQTGGLGGSTGSTDNAILRADGTGGATVQNSLVGVDDAGSINIPSGQSYKINNVALAYGDVGAAASNDSRLTDARDPKITSQTAVTTLADADESPWYIAGLTALRKITWGNIIALLDARFLKLNQTTPQTTSGKAEINVDQWDGEHYPLTTLGDLLYGGASGVATRLGIGAANTVLKGGTTPSWSAVVEADLGLTDITTGNVSAAAHGFAPKLSNNAAQFLNGAGNWTSPTAAISSAYSATSFTTQTSVNVVHNFGAYPLVQVVLDTGAVMVPYTITHNTLNDFTVTFSAATTGTILATLGSPQPMAYKTVTNDYQALVTDRVIECSAAGKSITMYTAVGNTGRELLVDNSSSGNITLLAYSGQTVQGETSQIIPPGSAINVYSNGSVHRIN